VSAYASAADLVVDDDQSMLDLFADILGDEGYRVLTCLLTADISTSIKRAQPDLVIVPLRSHRRAEDWILCLALASDPATASISLIVCTSISSDWRHPPPELRPRYLAFLDKPFHVHDLLSAVEAGLASVDHS
jgi:DNA-binding NtrC family response regulator